MSFDPKAVACPICGAGVGIQCKGVTIAIGQDTLHPSRIAEAKRQMLLSNLGPTDELDFIRSLTPTERSAYYDFRQQQRRRWRCGLRFRPGSLWVGVHWSSNNKRWCINLIPCVTFWVTKPGGKVP